MDVLTDIQTGVKEGSEEKETKLVSKIPEVQMREPRILTQENIDANIVLDEQRG